MSVPLAPPPPRTDDPEMNGYGTEPTEQLFDVHLQQNLANLLMTVFMTRLALNVWTIY